MRTAFILLTLVLSGPALPALAGDASGFDPKAIDECIAGGGGDCADAGMQACRDYAERKYTGDDPDFVEKNCLDAAHQAWEAKLAETYEALLASGGEAGEKLGQLKKKWIKLRDDLCGDLLEPPSARNQNAVVAKLTCQRNETARHWRFLNDIQEIRTK